jgi:hypothetical protein
MRESLLLSLLLLLVPACDDSARTGGSHDGGAADTRAAAGDGGAAADAGDADAGDTDAGDTDAGYADAATGPPKSTVLGQVAASMKPGELRELKTKGYTSGLVFALYGNELDKLGNGTNKDQIYNYSNKGAWDSNSRQFFFLGLGHNSGLKFISYSEAKNEWTLMPVPPWADPRVTQKDWPRGHAYSKNAVDVDNRLFLFFGLTKNIKRYHIDKKKWLTPVSFAPGMKTLKGANSGGTVFPELGGWVRFYLGEAQLYSPQNKTWSKLGSKGGVAMHALIEYSPKAKVVVYGGGKEPPALYAIDAAGTFTKIAKPPAGLPYIGTQSQILVPDPVTGEFIVGNIQRNKTGVTGDPHLHALDVQRNAWKQLPVKMPTSRYLVAGAVPGHDVIMLCGAVPAKVWLYKHKSPWP